MKFSTYLYLNQYMAEWIESWDLEAMMLCSREIGVHGPVGTSKPGFFSSQKRPSGSNMMKK